jgi:hypothetical protein
MVEYLSYDAYTVLENYSQSYVDAKKDCKTRSPRAGCEETLTALHSR